MVIGGGAAGMSAASAARRVAPELDVVVCEAGGFAAYGMCGIPYFLGGTVPRAENLLAYPPSEFRDHRGIDLRLHTAGQRDRRQRAPGAPRRRGGQRPARLRRAGRRHRSQPGAAAGARTRRAAGLHDPVPGRGDRTAAPPGQRHGPPRHRGRSRVHRPGNRGGPGLRGDRGRGHRGAAARARQRRRADRRAGPGGAGTACPAAARHPAGRRAPRRDHGQPDRSGERRGHRHRPGGHRDRACARPPTC